MAGHIYLVRALMLAALLQVVKFLGKGSYGSVFQVQRLGDGQTYALKVGFTRIDGPELRSASWTVS